MSLDIAEYIHATLSRDKKLTSMVGDRMFPIAAREETVYPFLIYTRRSVEASGATKDGSGYDDVDVVVTVLSDNYQESIEIAERVRHALDGTEGGYGGSIVDECWMTEAVEDYDGTS